MTKAIIAALLGTAALPGIAHAQSAASPFTTATRYDAARRVTGVILPDPDGSGPLKFGATRNSYDDAGRLIKVEKGQLANWQDETVAPRYWSGFELIRQTDITYDSMGRKLTEKVSDANAAYTLTQYSYDAEGRVECSAQRMNTAAFGNLPASACTLGAEGSFGSDRVTKNVYDPVGQLLQIRKAVGTSLEQGYVTNAYTPNGKRSDVIDAKGNRAHLTYDGFDRLDQWQLPSASTVSGFNDATPTTALNTAGSANTGDYESYGYDASGNRVGFRKRDGRQFTYGFDALNRMTSKIVPDGCAPGQSVSCPSADATRDVYYAYDADGRQTAARFDSAEGEGVVNRYNGFGELASSSNTMGGVTRTVDHEFDANGNQVLSTYAGRSWQFVFDGLDRPSELWQGRKTTLMSNWTYNRDGMRDGVAERFGSGVTWGYDGAGRLDSQTDSYAGGTGNVTTDLDYSPAGQIYERRLSNDAYAFSGRVNQSAGYSVNGLNQYTSTGNGSVTHDANGNLSSFNGATYGYDAENRLIAIAGTGSGTLRYDPLGRLYQSDGGTPGLTRFGYDGDQLVSEFDASGNATKTYVHGSADDDPLLWYEGGSPARWLHSDQQGTVTGFAASTSGAYMQANAYDEYGTPRPGNIGRFGYTGQAWLPDFGLWQYKARAYSPQLGRFLQTDPIGYDDQINLYAYVANDPVNQADPTGMECTKDRTSCTADTFVAARARIDVTQNAQVSSAVVAARGDYKDAAKGGEPTGTAKITSNGVTITPTVSKSGSTNTADTARFNLKGADAGIHGHLGGSVVDDPSSNRGYGDTQSLEQGKPMYTVEGDRVGVHDAPGGQLRFQMLQGSMTRAEARSIQQNLNREQKIFLTKEKR